MLELEIDFSNPEERAEFKKRLILDITSIIALLESVPQRKKAKLDEMSTTAINNLNQYCDILKKMIEPRDKIRVAEFYRKSYDVVEEIKERCKLIQDGWEFPMPKAVLPLSEELHQLSMNFICCV